MTDIFPPGFTDNLPEDATSGCAAICAAVIDYSKRRLVEAGKTSLIEDQQNYVNALALFEAYTETYPLNIQYHLPSLHTNAEQNSKSIISFFETLCAALNERIVKSNLSRLRENYVAKFGHTAYYEFNDKERDLIRTAFHELRVLVNDVETLEAADKVRLMNRLGKIHEELPHKLPDFDRIWGLVGEALLIQVSYGGSGDLIVERLRQIINSAWEAQARSESKTTGSLDDLLCKICGCGAAIR